MLCPINDTFRTIVRGAFVEGERRRHNWWTRGRDVGDVVGRAARQSRIDTKLIQGK
jgi:hypothetical protein